MVKTNSSTLQKYCPVMGGEIDKSLYVDYDNKRIFVCCSGCVETVKKDLENISKYLKKGGYAGGSEHSFVRQN
jgi:hypothetical protein